MSKFDDRVNQLVDGKLLEVYRDFQDGPNNFPNLEADFEPVMEKLRVMHNLLADVKQEIRRVEKNNPKDKDDVSNPDQRLPDGVDVTNLTLEDLRQYIGTGTEVGPYDPSENVWDAFERNFRRWFSKLRIPGLSPDYIEELLKGIKDAGLLNVIGLSPKDLWYYLTHPDVRDAIKTPGFGEILKMLLFPGLIGSWLKDVNQQAKDTINEARAQSSSEASNMKQAVSQSAEVINSNIASAVETAQDLSQQILTEVVSCCSSTHQKLDIIKRSIDEGGGPVVKQDTLLVRKKMAEIDSVLEELRRELRLVSEIRGKAEEWFEERQRDSLSF